MTEHLHPPRLAGRYWPALVVGLLALNVGIVLLTIIVAARDPSVATEPDYYAKAMKYDDVIRQRTLNAKLGWSASCSLRTDHGASLVVALRDRDGEPLEGAMVTAVVFSGLRSDERQNLELGALPSHPGEYAAQVKIDRAGTWVVRVSAQHEGVTFTYDTELMITPQRSGT